MSPYWFVCPLIGLSAVTSVYIYAGPNCIAEYTSGQSPANPNVEFVYAQAVDSLALVDTGTKKLAALRNQQWSVTALVDNATGSVEERYAYDHFGKRTILEANGSTVRTVSAHNNPYGYTSRRHEDETGLMYFRARCFDPSTGEFISRDPLGYVDGMSLYRGYFVPRGMDPSGYYQEQEQGLYMDDPNGDPIDPANNKRRFIKSWRLVPRDRTDGPGISARARFEDLDEINKIKDDSLMLTYDPNTNRRVKATLAGDEKIADEQFINGEWCTEVEQSLLLKVDIEMLFPDPTTDPRVMNQEISGVKGYLATQGHEFRRFNVYVEAYLKYDGELQSQVKKCGCVCRAKPGDATKFLHAFVLTQTRRARNTFNDWTFVQQKLIGDENDRKIRDGQRRLMGFNNPQTMGAFDEVPWKACDPLQ